MKPNDERHEGWYNLTRPDAGNCNCEAAAKPLRPAPRTFKLRGGEPHRASYICEGQHLLNDGEEITVREVLAAGSSAKETT